MRRRLLSKAFLDWAAPKLSSLAMARRHDALADLPGPQWYFIGVLDGIMSEYENLPFAQATYPGNLDIHGNVRYTKKQLRRAARAYLRTHSWPNAICGLAHGLADPAIPPITVSVASAMLRPITSPAGTTAVTTGSADASFGARYSVVSMAGAITDHASDSPTAEAIPAVVTPIGDQAVTVPVDIPITMGPVAGGSRAAAGVYLPG